MSDLIKTAFCILQRNVGARAEEYYRSARASTKWDQNITASIAKCYGTAVLRGGFLRGDGGDILAFNGRNYESVSERQLETVITLLMEDQDLPAIYISKGCDMVRKYCTRMIETRVFQPRRSLLSMANGVLDVETMMFSGHDAALHCALSLPTVYDRDAKCPRFERYLEEVLPDRPTRMVLQEFVGALLVDRRKIKLESMCYLLGGGANGKSVFYDIVVNIFGKSNVTMFSMSRLTKDNHKEYNVAAINGKIVNFCSDMSDSDFSGGEYKQIVSGEDMQARVPCGKPFQATMIPPMMCSLNQMPRTKDQSDGHKRRNLIIPFERHFTKEERDAELPNKLREEYSGIFNWILEGTARYVAQKGHFTESAKIAKALELNEIESNTVMLWVMEKGYDAEGDKEDDHMDCSAVDGYRPIKSAYREYQEFCKDNGQCPYSNVKFTKMIKDLMFPVKRNSSGSLVKFMINSKAFADDAVEEECPF